MNNNYFISSKFFNPNISFGFFTRKQGYSKNNFNSLNCSNGIGDDNSLVLGNIEIAQNAINLQNKKIKFINQTHSNNIVLIDNENFNTDHQADGMITQEKDISIAILTADCCPIFIFDNSNSFISCLHVGWKGCYKNIIQQAFKKIFNIQNKKEKINVIIGPCLGKNFFEVSNDFKNIFIDLSKDYSNFFYNSKNIKTKSFFDMRSLIKYQIFNLGITNIDNINLDTYSNKELFFSHRRSTHLNQLPTGRMINIIGFIN